jgi:hypothetical protein
VGPLWRSIRRHRATAPLKPTGERTDSSSSWTSICQGPGREAMKLALLWSPDGSSIGTRAADALAVDLFHLLIAVARVTTF